MTEKGSIASNPQVKAAKGSLDLIGMESSALSGPF